MPYNFAMVHHASSPPLFRDQSHMILVHQKIQFLLELHVVEPEVLHFRGKGFYSLYLLLPKEKGEWQSLVALRLLNMYMASPKFCMVTLAYDIRSNALIQYSQLARHTLSCGCISVTHKASPHCNTEGTSVQGRLIWSLSCILNFHEVSVGGNHSFTLSRYLCTYTLTVG